MDISNLSQDDAKHLAHTINLVATCNKFVDALSGMGFRFEGLAFQEKEQTLKWLQKDVAHKAASLLEKSKPRKVDSKVTKKVKKKVK